MDRVHVLNVDAEPRLPDEPALCVMEGMGGEVGGADGASALRTQAVLLYDYDMLEAVLLYDYDMLESLDMKSCLTSTSQRHSTHTSRPRPVLGPQTRQSSLSTSCPG